MKKILSMILMSVILISAAGCAASSNEDVVLPPTRIGTSDVYVSLGTNYTFTSAFSEADVVARIEVGNWIAEDTDLQKTYYEATVLQCFKGNIPSKFTLIQDGCSTGTFINYPLFTSGNELLVFLNEATVTAAKTDYQSPYWIIGSYTTVLDVSYDDSGVRYYADPYGILGETIDISTNYAHEDDIRIEVYSRAVEADPIVADRHPHYRYIFSENDIIALLEDL